VLPDATRRTAGGCDGLRSLDRLTSAVLRYGGRLDELEIKMFGGGRVITAATTSARSMSRRSTDTSHRAPGNRRVRPRRRRRAPRALRSTHGAVEVRRTLMCEPATP